MCRIFYPGSQLSVHRRIIDDGSVSVELNVWETSVEADFKSVEYREKPDGNAWLQYWKGPTAGTIEGSTEDIKRTFAEILPFTHIMKTLKNRIDGITNDGQCRELIDFIETHPTAEYKESGRAWLEKFLIDKEDRAFELLQQHGGEIYTYKYE
ncbi:hypothetical protein FOZ63_027507 [Perkinsus olseni]|uniref:Uncharacterized protein n=1 Tax=Perkinsus olseni TaxID=32597 RepID=A0A7J6NFY3_PEROL|nr:hypothetical protein FOZ60_010265 [Perkinsus olseni]KAF4726887.1 hypothetical protein FOZ63_027507 [Perkinsus olseni]